MVYCVHVEQPVPFEKVPSTFYRELKSKHDEKKTKLDKRMKENGTQKRGIQVTCVYTWMKGVCKYIGHAGSLSVGWPRLCSPSFLILAFFLAP